LGSWAQWGVDPLAEREAFVDQIVHDLRAGGHRVTPQRVAIIREFVGRADHPSAEAIHQAVVAQFPMIAISTVYSTIRLLVEMGAAAEVSPGLTGARFDPNTSSHCHVVCTRCGSIADVPTGPELPTPEAWAETLGSGFRVERLTLDIHGVCARCAARGGDAPA